MGGGGGPRDLCWYRLLKGPFLLTSLRQKNEIWHQTFSTKRSTFVYFWPGPAPPWHPPSFFKRRSPWQKGRTARTPPSQTPTQTLLSVRCSSLKPATHSALIIPLSQLYLDTRFIFLYLSAYIFYQMHYMILIVGLLFIVAYFQFTRNKYWRVLFVSSRFTCMWPS